jgi:hypothetical protein
MEDICGIVTSYTKCDMGIQDSLKRKVPDVCQQRQDSYGHHVQVQQVEDTIRQIMYDYRFEFRFPPEKSVPESFDETLYTITGGR